ncbi:unnamed protein product [Brugia timori]|uniref:Secreted protein n=1 Tax=Brugia timori TaxID=42155 RepID=A0A0R3QAU8_9BILA|nr:unnamed protein product [Brugia timori]
MFLHYVIRAIPNVSNANNSNDRAFQGYSVFNCAEELTKISVAHCSITKQNSVSRSTSILFPFTN